LQPQPGPQLSGSSSGAASRTSMTSTLKVSVLPAI